MKQWIVVSCCRRSCFDRTPPLLHRERRKRIVFSRGCVVSRIGSAMCNHRVQPLANTSYYSQIPFAKKEKSKKKKNTKNITNAKCKIISLYISSYIDNRKYNLLSTLRRSIYIYYNTHTQAHVHSCVIYFILQSIHYLASRSRDKKIRHLTLHVRYNPIACYCRSE